MSVAATDQGKGVYLTGTLQKAEGYRIHHPGAAADREYNAPLRSGEPDPGCILKLRVAAGVMKNFDRDDKSASWWSGSQGTTLRHSWHNEFASHPNREMRAAATEAGVGVKHIRFNSAFSSGCPCCDEHGDDCPGHPDRGHRPPPGTSPCQGRCKWGLCSCPKSLSSLEEFCIYSE